MNGQEPGRDYIAGRFESYRDSFRKTSYLAGFGGFAFFIAAVVLAQVNLPALLVVFVLGGSLLCLSVFAAGRVVIYRHDRERAGKPDLYWALLQEIEINPPRGIIRRLFSPRIRAGTVVRVRPAAEIFESLDRDRRTDGIPFMPEMRKYCGRTFYVHRIIDKINDWTGRTGTGLRRLKGFVTLREIRCDGTAHGMCQADCQILWHTSWLTTNLADDPHNEIDQFDVAEADQSGEPTVQSINSARCYTCQITELVKASRRLHSWDLRQDLRPLLFGNVDLRAFAVALLTRFFNVVQRVRKGMTYPMMPKQRATGPTPSTNRNLCPGDTVRTMTKAEIGQTLFRNRNRGLWFGAETMRFCGQEYVVRSRVERFVDENSGKIVEPSMPFVVLESVTATGEFLRFCPQNEFVYWREIWLSKIDP